MISNCGHDENGRYSGGRAGDQTGDEWYVRPWYNRPWDCVLRHPDARVQNAIATLARDSANNNLIGYDQNQRYTYWEHLKASNYDAKQITIACEADCSSGIAAIVKAVGYKLNMQALKNVSIYLYTGNMKAGLRDAGFQVLTASKYLTSDKYLLPGDILLNEAHHVATNLDKGIYATSSGGSSNSGGSSSKPSGNTSGRADYSKVTVSESSAQTKAMVMDAQTHLNNFVGAGLAVDGDRGTATKKAEIKALQQALNMDGASPKLSVDGVIGAATKAALKKRYVQKGHNNNLVTLVEIALLAKGYNPKGVEQPGSFGSGLEAAVRAYQNAHKDVLEVDGVAGYNTIMLLLS